MLLMISLDSENADWLREHMASGSLPNLAALARSGVTVDVEAALLAGTAYPALHSGRRPADLGCYFPLQWDPGNQCVVDWHGRPLPQETIFERIDKSGKRIVVLDPPESHPVQMKRGFAASGVQFRARVLLHSWSSDAARLNKLMRRVGPAPRADEIFGEASAMDFRYLRSVLLQAPARLAAAAHEFLRQDPPDCLWLTCCGLHIASHQFLHLPSIQDARERRELEGTRLELAQGYDRMIGDVVQALPAGSRVIVTYAKGMGPVTEWSDLLPAMLGLVLGQKKGNEPASLLRRLIPRPVRRWMALSMSDRKALEVMARLSTPQTDWTETRAFCLPTDYPGFIRFNLAGREREGIVADSALQALREEIAEGLRTFTDLDGCPCVERVFRPLEFFGSGTRIEEFPDLIVTWRQRPGESQKTVRSAKFGEIRRTADVVGRSGNHCPGAFAILAGGAAAADPLERPMQVVDIPATILHGLGLPAEDLPGRSYWAS